MFEGLAHHIDTWREAWKLDKEEAPKRKKVSEADFLPASLEILEKPASPIGRATIFLMITFFTIALLWSYFGRVDVVASAQGKIIPKGYIKVIQPVEIGVVRAIHVENGQAVAAGDVLLELDPTFSDADEERVRREKLIADITIARQQALLDYLDQGTPDFQSPKDAPDDMVRMQQKLITSQISEHEARIAAFERQLAERQVDLKLTRKQLAKLEQTLPLVDEQLNARKESVEKGSSPRIQYLELKERHVTLLNDIEIERDRLNKAGVDIEAIEKQITQTRYEFRNTVLNDLTEASEQAMIATQELIKAQKRNVLQKLTAPVEGVVQQLAVHTIGGVVQAGDPLMVIVPAETELEVEALVLNKDIGFVETGQETELKLEAFPFTKYGVIDGTILDLGNDAIQDENLGLVYPARISMQASSIKVRDKYVRLGPGMAVTAEIKTGKRRLIEFILSPLLRYKDESLTER